MDIKCFHYILGIMVICFFNIKRSVSISVDSQDGPTTQPATSTSQRATSLALTANEEMLKNSSNTTESSEEHLGLGLISDKVNEGVSLVNLKKLHSDLLSGYDVTIRPRLDQSKSVEVNVSLRLASVVEFDTTGQRFGVMGYFYITWIDDVIKWNPTLYGGTTNMKLPLSKIWFPPLVIGLTYSGSESIGKVDKDRVTVTADGTVTWAPDGIYKFMCKVSVRYYPFDTQTCELILYVSDEDVTSVNFSGHEVKVGEFMENSEWYLLEVSSKTMELFNTSFVYNYIKVKRRAEFTVYTMILPLFTLALLNVFTFLVPIESGEKGSLAITLFLAYGFFITITRDSLPHNSLQVSFYVLYLAILLMLSVFTVIYVIIEYKIYSTIGTHPFVLCWRFRFKTSAAERITSENNTEDNSNKICLDKKIDTWTDVMGRTDVLATISSGIFVFIVSLVVWTFVIQGN
ncbi:acetylcholine receptor subunit beta-like [Ruditapes philippinarum]|uniref:acetylcholine receptor subunit beta-like n=1 Tax=Ruditapes philippinarum TaxID=129788 RepID=UPI00295A8EA7|nr:acetylcholine receptor subunit beta-like [Ruditapes philippinarum]